MSLLLNEPYQPTWESLRTFECPEWYRDAKLGIWSHWGPQSVPMYGDWYARNMYLEGSDQYRYHWRVYGHPSEVGYKDIIKQWHAESFDPEGLMDLYVAAGARYFTAQAAHHDHFHNWNSRHHRWNAVNMGPKKDIVGLWRQAALDRGLKFGVTEHLGAAFTWGRPNKGADATGPYAGVPYDGNDPAFEDLYLPNRDVALSQHVDPWYTSNPAWHAQWLQYMEDLIDQYQPDLLYSDGGVPFDDVGLQAIAHLYNTSARLHGGVNQAIYNQKDRDPMVYRVGVLDIERSQLPAIQPEVWQTDTCVGHWFYDVRAVYKTGKQVAEILVDVVSKNGNLLLNLPQRPDGTLDDECQAILQQMAAWTLVNGEGIYGTRPWQVSGEGPSSVVIDHFHEEPVPWTIEDFRFTRKDSVVYAFLMKWPEGGHTVVRSLGLSAGRVQQVELLGSQGPISFHQEERGLAVVLPKNRPCDYTQCLKVTLA
ncbi:MAG: alpha-L-fucosidase [Firmicutes bacterium]|jgi:alpha-L-fucosidase|nr:alpha-L-fucosidase [Bacillota bacterium]